MKHVLLFFFLCCLLPARAEQQQWVNIGNHNYLVTFKYSGQVLLRYAVYEEGLPLVAVGQASDNQVLWINALSLDPKANIGDSATVYCLRAQNSGNEICYAFTSKR